LSIVRLIIEVAHTPGAGLDRRFKMGPDHRASSGAVPSSGDAEGMSPHPVDFVVNRMLAVRQPSRAGLRAYNVIPEPTRSLYELYEYVKDTRTTRCREGRGDISSSGFREPQVEKMLRRAEKSPTGKVVTLPSPSRCRRRRPGRRQGRVTCETVSDITASSTETESCKPTTGVRLWNPQRETREFPFDAA